MRRYWKWRYFCSYKFSVQVRVDGFVDTIRDSRARINNGTDAEHTPFDAWEVCERALSVQGPQVCASIW